MLSAVFLLSIYSFQITQGMNCCGCFGYRSQTRIIEDNSNPRISQSRSFMNLNQSSSRLDAPFNQRPSIMHGDDAYNSCPLIIDNIPWTALSAYHRNNSQFRDDLIRKCTKRWRELMNPSLKYRVSDTTTSLRNPLNPQRVVTSNLVVFQLNGVLIDTRNFGSEMYRSPILREHNKHDLVFMPVPRWQNDEDNYLWFRTRRVAIYRRGLMDLLHSIRSSRMINNTFNFAVFGHFGDPSEHRMDVVFHAVAIETYYNFYYLPMILHRNGEIGGDRLNELRINFKFAKNEMTRLSVDENERVIVVDSEIRVRALSNLHSRVIGIRVEPFAIKTKASLLVVWCLERIRNDKSLEMVRDLIVDIDSNSKRSISTMDQSVAEEYGNLTESVWSDNSQSSMQRHSLITN